MRSSVKWPQGLSFAGLDFLMEKPATLSKRWMDKTKLESKESSARVLIQFSFKVFEECVKRTLKNNLTIQQQSTAATLELLPCNKLGVCLYAFLPLDNQGSAPPRKNQNSKPNQEKETEREMGDQRRFTRFQVCIKFVYWRWFNDATQLQAVLWNSMLSHTVLPCKTSQKRLQIWSMAVCQRCKP